MKKFSIALCFQHNQIARLSNPQACRPQFSDSPIQSIAAFILEIMPHLQPPNIKKDKNIPAKPISNNQESYYNPFFQAWTNYVNQCIINCHAVYYQNTLYVELALPINRETLPTQLIGSVFELQQFNQSTNFEARNRVLEIFKLPQIQLKSKKIGVIVYEKEQNQFVPQVNSLGLFLGNCYNNEKWQVLTVTEQNIPSVQELVAFDYIIIPGSKLSVIDSTKQIKRSTQSLLNAHKINQNMKILAVCFGHQLISQFFGAKVEKKQRKGGLEIIQIDRSIIESYSFFSPLLNLDYCRMSQHHQDYVQEVPVGFRLVAKSASCKVESLLSSDARILTTQFHSEFFCKFTEGYQKRALHYNNVNPLPHFYVPANSSLENQNLEHSRLFLDVFRRYLQS